MTHRGTPRVEPLADFGILDQAPQALFEDVEAQVFPLFADGRQLQLFLDEYYNATIPREISYMRALAPIVFMTVLYYPRIHGRYREEASSLRQHEYYFLIPVGRYEMKNGCEELRETGVVTPYIFVDDAVSATLGREIYGWQKRLFRISPVAPTGANLKQSKPYMRIEQPTPGRDGTSMTFRPQVQIYCAEANEPWDPLRDFGKALGRASVNLDVLYRTLGGHAHTDRPALERARKLQMLSQLGAKLIAPDGRLDVLLMAQFPHCSRALTVRDTTHFVASYTALTHAQVGLRWLRKFAQLGRSPPWDPDTSRGFCIHFSGHGVDNIPSRLGLQVDEHTTDEEDCPVQVVRPFLPFVSGFDMSIESLRTIARRTTHTHWVDEDDRVLVRRPSSRAAALYNTYLGASSAQGFKSYGKTPQTLRFKALGLRADPRRLATAVRALAPTPDEFEIAPRLIDGAGAVMVIVDNVRRDRSDRNELVWFSGTYLCFAILCDVRWRGQHRVAFLDALGFTDNAHAMLVGRELLAADRLLARFDGATNPWFPPQPAAADAASAPALLDPERDAKAGRRHVLRMRTDVLTSINAGDRIQEKTMLDIFECAHGSGATHDHDHGEVAGFEQVGMRLGARGSLVPFIRVGTIPTTHSNRLGTAVVRVHYEEITLGALTEGPEIGSWPLEPHQIRIHRHQSMDVVARLGLHAQFEDEQGTDLCSTALALGGRFDGVHREVEALYEWTPQRGWLEERGVPRFFDAADGGAP